MSYESLFHRKWFAALLLASPASLFNHQITICMVDSAGRLLHGQKGEFTQSARCFERCAQGYQATFGQEHPDTIDATKKAELATSKR
jgi:hypothetical protein